VLDVLLEERQLHPETHLGVLAGGLHLAQAGYRDPPAGRGSTGGTLRYDHISP